MSKKNIALLGISTLPVIFCTHNTVLASPLNDVLAVNYPSKQSNGFIKDSKLSIKARNFWIRGDNRQQGDYSGQAQEWGQSFIIQYQSGYTEGTLGFGIDALALVGFRLDDGGRVGKSDINRTPGNIFPTGHGGKAKSQFGSFGVAPKVHFSHTAVQYGTLMPNLPIVGTNDERLLPQTYEGGMVTVNELKNFTFVTGNLAHVREVNGTHNHTLAVDGAARGIGSNKFYFGGVDYRVTQDLTLQYYYSNLKDFYVQHFIGAAQNWKLPKDAGNLKAELRYFYSDSDGKNRSISGRSKGYTIKGYNNNGEVDNRVYSGLVTYSIKTHQLLAGYQVVSGRSNFPFVSQVSSQGAPLAKSYLFTNSQIGKFLNAGERTWLVGYGYNFSELGLPGLSTSVKYLRGDQIKTKTGDLTEWERDFILSYIVQTGSLKGLEFIWKNASIRSKVTNTKNTDRNRLYISYEFKFDSL